MKKLVILLALLNFECSVAPKYDIVKTEVAEKMTTEIKLFAIGCQVRCIGESFYQSDEVQNLDKYGLNNMGFVKKYKELQKDIEILNKVGYLDTYKKLDRPFPFQPKFGRLGGGGSLSSGVVTVGELGYLPLLDEFSKIQMSKGKTTDSTITGKVKEFVSKPTEYKEKLFYNYNENSRLGSYQAVSCLENLFEKLEKEHDVVFKDPNSRREYLSLVKRAIEEKSLEHKVTLSKKCTEPSDSELIKSFDIALQEHYGKK